MVRPGKVAANDFTAQPSTAVSAESADIADGRVASHDRRQGDLDAAGNRGARQRRQGGLDRREAAGERQAGALADGLGIVDADLGALRLDLEARLAAEIDQGAAVRRVGVGRAGPVSKRNSSTVRRSWSSAKRPFSR